MRNFRKLPVPVQTAHGYPCAHVPTGGSFLNPPPLFASNRSSKNIAELARLRSLRASPFRKSVRGVLQNRILMGAGDCGGRLRIRDTAKTVRELFSLFLQITDRPRKMRQYRLNRESILYIEGRRPANTPRGHRKSCRDEFETRRKKMKPQSSFQGACRYFLQGLLCRYFPEAFSLSIRLRGRRFASCRVRKKVKRSAHNPYSGLFGNPRQTRVSNLAIAPNMQLRTFGKILNPAFQIDRPQTPIFSFLSPFKTV